VTILNPPETYDYRTYKRVKEEKKKQIDLLQEKPPPVRREINIFKTIDRFKIKDNEFK